MRPFQSLSLGNGYVPTRATFRYSLWSQVRTGLLALVLFAVMVALCVKAWTLPSYDATDALKLAAFGALFGASSVAVVWWLLQLLGAVVYLDGQGIELVQRGKRKALRWTEVAQVEVAYQRHAGFFGLSEIRQRVKHLRLKASTQQLLLTSDLVGFPELLSTLQGLGLVSDRYEP